MLKTYIIAAIASLTAFLLLDALWLGVIARSSYQNAMKGMLRDSIFIAPAIIFYVMYSLAIAHLVIIPQLNGSTWLSVFIQGAILGMAAYGAYNMTNYSILDGWPLGITIQDWCWGIVVTGLSSLAGWYAVRYFIIK